MTTFTCNMCSKILVSEQLPAEWVTFTEVTLNGIRLFERVRTHHYESFHIPNKEEKFYCGRDCAFNNLKTSIDIFISEIQSLTSKSRGSNTV